MIQYDKIDWSSSHYFEGRGSGNVSWFMLSEPTIEACCGNPKIPTGSADSNRYAQHPAGHIAYVGYLVRLKS